MRGYGKLCLLILLGACSLTACAQKNENQEEKPLPIVEEVVDAAEKNEYTGIGYRFLLDSDWTYEEKTKTELNFVYQGDGTAEDHCPTIHSEVTFFFREYGKDFVSKYYLSRKKFTDDGYEINRAEMVAMDNCDGYRTELVHEEKDSMITQYFVVHEDTQYTFVLEASVAEYEEVSDVIDRMVSTITWEPVIKQEAPEEGAVPLEVSEADMQNWTYYEGKYYSLKLGENWIVCNKEEDDEDYENIKFTAKYNSVMDGVDEKIEILRVDERNAGYYYDLENKYPGPFLETEFEVPEGYFYTIAVDRGVTVSGQEGFWELEQLDDARTTVYRLSYFTYIGGVEYEFRYEGDITDFEIIRPEVEAILTTVNFTNAGEDW